MASGDYQGYKFYSQPYSSVLWLIPGIYHHGCGNDYLRQYPVAVVQQGMVIPADYDRSWAIDEFA